MAPFSLLALGLLWWPVNMVFGVPFRWTVVVFAASGLLLFVRPFQTAVLTPILGARPAQPEEAALIAPAWAEIAQANNLPPNRYALRVLPSDELNAFACGGHLVVVTSFAAQELTPAQLRGVLAHEISHHLGLHTVAITIAHWLSAPVVFLAQIGFFFENVSQAAAQSFGRHSPVIEVVGCAAPGPRQRHGRSHRWLAGTADSITSGGPNTRRSNRSAATPPGSLNTPPLAQPAAAKRSSDTATPRGLRQ